MSVEENFNEYISELFSLFDEDFFQDQHTWIMESEQFVCWSLMLYNKKISPIKAVKIIERAYERYEK